jgi:peptidoglycan/LPS O-acetylase OafA/YrhL
MATQFPAAKVPLWAQALRLIPTLVWVLCVALLLTYKPDGYQGIVGGFALAFALTAVIMILAARKIRTRKQKNG